MPMPYVVKGMDMSFTGLLSFCEDLVLNNELLKKELENTIITNGDAQSNKILKKNSVNRNI